MERTTRHPGRTVALAGLVALLAAAPACRHQPSPVERGLNTRDLIEPDGQRDVDELGLGRELIGAADAVRDAVAARAPAGAPRHVLCLSGGGAYGAYSAGVLVGWTASGARPTFDAVTGISTGALIAPFAFLGPKYDPQLQAFYTTVTQRDVFRLRPVRQLGAGALADTAPLARAVDAFLTPEVVAEIAAAHAAGRRLYVGTTEVEGRRFVAWDVGALAARGDRELIKRVLLGSAAIPGVFPPSKIGVTVDGRSLTERHVDGGASRAIFFRPPHADAGPTGRALAGTTVWAIVAGKLFADPQPLGRRFFDLAGSSVSAVIYSQTRSELSEIWALCELTGMRFLMTSIPEDFPAPASSSNFDPKVLQPMFAAGYCRGADGSAWRSTPPGGGYGEPDLGRTGTALTVRDRRLSAGGGADGMPGRTPEQPPAVPRP